MGHLPPHGARRYVPSLCRIHDDRTYAGRAFVARATGPYPAHLEPCLPGGVGAATRDTRRSRMGDRLEDRAEGHEPLHATARGHVEEQRRVRAPPLLGLDAAKQQQPCPTIGWLPGPKRDPWPADGALPLDAEAYDRPEGGKVDERFWVDRGERRGRGLAGQGTQNAGGGPPRPDPSAQRPHPR